jgi:hypothetical protein
VKTKLSVIQDVTVTTDGLYCGESRHQLCGMWTPGGKCALFGFLTLSSDDDGWLRADACVKAEERALETVA